MPGSPGSAPGEARLAEDAVLDLIVGTEHDPLRGSCNAGRYLMFDGELANVTGNPAMSIPVGLDRDGLPTGIHILGRFGDEATLLRLAAQLEDAMPWGVSVGT